MRIPIARATFAVLAALLEPGASAALTPAEAQAKVNAFVVADVQGAGLQMPPDFTYTLTLFDLNGDGVEEALIVYKHSSWCGSHGCSAYVLDVRGATPCSLGDLIAHQLMPAPTFTNGWRDLDGGVNTIQFEGGKYGVGSSSC